MRNSRYVKRVPCKLKKWLHPFNWRRIPILAKPLKHSYQKDYWKIYASLPPPFSFEPLGIGLHLAQKYKSLAQRFLLVNTAYFSTSTQGVITSKCERFFYLSLHPTLSVYRVKGRLPSHSSILATYHPFSDVAKTTGGCRKKHIGHVMLHLDALSGNNNNGLTQLFPAIPFSSEILTWHCAALQSVPPVTSPWIRSYQISSIIQKRESFFTAILSSHPPFLTPQRPCGIRLRHWYLMTWQEKTWPSQRRTDPGSCQP